MILYSILTSKQKKISKQFKIELKEEKHGNISMDVAADFIATTTFSLVAVVALLVILL